MTTSCYVGRSRVLSYKGSDMTSFLRILSLMTDGMRKHLTTMTTDED